MTFWPHAALTANSKRKSQQEAATTIQAPSAALLRLPLWQTAVAGGLAGLGARFLAGSIEHFLKAGFQTPKLRAVSPAMAAATRMSPTGAICCTGYVNLLSLAS